MMHKSEVSGHVHKKITDTEHYYIHDYPEEESQMFASCLFAGHENLTELELRSPVEENNAEKILKARTNKGRKLNSAVNLLFSKNTHTEIGRLPPPRATGLPPKNSGVTNASFTSKYESASQPIHTVYSRGERSSARNIQQSSYMQIPSVRETLLEEAWERKRDHILHHEQSSYMQIPSVRETLLEEAWERKRDHILHHELNSTKEKLGLEKVGWSEKIPRARSLTDDDFDELRGSIDLGFGFSQDYTPDLCETLPALEICYAITQKLQDSQSFLSPVSTLNGIQGPLSPTSSPSESPISSWQICSPGENPQQVKARLRHWAQAVACTARQCY